MSDKRQEPWEFSEPLCREIGGEMFFAGDEDDPQSMDSNIINTLEAKKICQTCAHIVECADWGIHHERYGVWGGLSPHEMIIARRKRNIVMQSVTLSRVL